MARDPMERSPAIPSLAGDRNSNSLNLHDPAAADDLADLRKRVAELEAELAAVHEAALVGVPVLRPHADASWAELTNMPSLPSGSRWALNSLSEMQAYGIVTLDAEGRISSCNAEAVRVYGLTSPEEVISKHFSCLYPPEDVAAGTPERDLYVAAHHGQWEQEVRRLRKSGERFWALATICPLRDNRGELRGFVTLLRDITIRKRDDERWQLFVELALNSMIIVNQRGEIVQVNPRTEKMFGYAREELVGKPVDVLAPDWLKEQHPSFRGDFLAAPVPLASATSRELYGRRKNGSEFPVEVNLTPVKMDEGLLIVGSVIDVTERKEAEKKFRLAVESAPSAMVMINQQGEILLVNLQTEKMFGYSRESLLGQRIELLVPERFRDGHPEYRKDYFSHPAARPMGAGRDLHGRRKDGSEFPVEIGLTPIETEDGMFVLSAIADLTERRLAEERSSRHLAEIAHAGRLSTIGEMFSGLAHEINQPLAAAANYARACVRYAQSDQGVSNDQLIEWMEKAAAQASRASDIVQRVGRFVRRGQTQHAALDLNRIIEHVVLLPMMEVLPPETAARTTPELQLAPHLPEAMGDRVQIEQVLVNLIRNAMEAMVDVPADRRRLVVKTSVAGGEIRVAVQDSGHGISEQSFTQLFSPFFTTKASGMGLGLSISRSIIEAHSGRLWAEANADGGATFQFSLPIFLEGNST